jgi:hypothetical protein
LKSRVTASAVIGLIVSAFATRLEASPLRVRVELAASAWSLQPFTTPIEDETENVIEREILRFLRPVLQYITPPPIRENLELESEGVCGSATLWVPLLSNRLEAGARVSYARLRVPFVLTVEQTYEILGYDLVKVRGAADGRVRFDTMMFGLLGRWTFLRSGRLSWSLTAGATALPFEGDVEGRYELSASSPIGSISKTGSDRITIEELRRDHEDIPSVLVAPFLSTACAIRVSGRIGLVLEAALSQGSFLSAGLSIAL